MNKTWILLRTNLSITYNLGRFRRSAKGGMDVKPRTLVASVGVIAVLALLLTSISGFYALVVAALNQTGQTHAFLPFIASLACVSPFFMGLYKAPGLLYASRDYGLLAALPVKPGAILASKVLTLYVSCMAFCLFIAVPGIVVYGNMAGEGAAFFVPAFTMLLFLPLAPITAGALLSFPIMYAASRFRRANAVILVLYMLIVVAVIVANFAITPGSAEEVASGVTSINGVAEAYPPVSQFARTLTDGGAVPGLTMALTNAAVFTVFVFIFARSFAAINAAMGERHTVSRFKLSRVGVSGMIPALIGKEMKNIFSNYVYIINTGIGMILFTVYNIAILVMGYDSVVAMLEMPGGGDMYIGATALVGAFCVAASTVSAPSISIEGKSLWILQSLPIRFWDAAKAKAFACLSITAPLVFINTTVICFASNADFTAYAALTLALLAFCAFTAPLGVIMNLFFPKLEWTNPVQPVKQSASVMLTMFTGFAVAGLEALLAFVMRLDFTVFFFAAAGINAVLSLCAWAFLYAKGQSLFERI